MTVNELIEELRKYPPDSNIFLSAMPVVKKDYKCRIELNRDSMISLKHENMVLIACRFALVSGRKFDEFWARAKSLLDSENDDSQ